VLGHRTANAAGSQRYTVLYFHSIQDLLFPMIRAPAPRGEDGKTLPVVMAAARAEELAQQE
jgi:hypothetical protein